LPTSGGMATHGNAWVVRRVRSIGPNAEVPNCDVLQVPHLQISMSYRHADMMDQLNFTINHDQFRHARHEWALDSRHRGDSGRVPRSVRAEGTLVGSSTRARQRTLYSYTSSATVRTVTEHVVAIQPKEAFIQECHGHPVCSGYKESQKLSTT